MQDNAIKTRNRILAEKVIKNLQSRKFDAYYCDNSTEAVSKAISLIPENSSVSWGGSATIKECGLIDAVNQGNFTVIDRDTASNLTERFELMRKALLCDTYLTSFNAISEDGVIINIDGIGNRVAAIAFGPKNVIAIVGMNKVCKNIDEAISRARNFAAPVNAARLYSSNSSQANLPPCVSTGTCANCKTDGCICSYIAETRMCKIPNRIKIILVGETLGF